MKVEIFNLCDFASVDAGAKLTLVGVFDSIHVMSAPAAYGFFALAARLRFEKIEEGTKRIRISFVDADGQSIVPSFEAQIWIQCPPGESSPIAHFVSIVSQVQFPKLGEYAVGLAIDGRQEASTPLIVRQWSPNQADLPTQPPMK